MCTCNPPMNRYCEAHVPLAPWERELLTGYREGEADVEFSLLDGSTFVIERVRADSVGPSGNAPGVIGVEFFDSDRVVHVPFVRSWEFDYPGSIVSM